MEYTKDMILHVDYGQGVKAKKEGWRLFYRISEVLAKHKMMTVVVSITFMLMFLDIMLVTSFVDILSNMNL